jgi:rare lipoprotein A
VASRLVLAGLVLSSTAWLNTTNAKEQVQRKTVHNPHKTEKKTKLIVKSHKISKSPKTSKQATKPSLSKPNKTKKIVAKLNLKHTVKAKPASVKTPTLKLHHKAEKAPKVNAAKQRVAKLSKSTPQFTKALARQSLKSLPAPKLRHTSKADKMPALSVTKHKSRHEAKLKTAHNVSKLAKQSLKAVKQAKLLERQQKTSRQASRLDKQHRLAAASRTPLNNKPKVEEKRQAGQVLQVGTASYYGSQFNGGRTASGERFNQNDLTCAHNGLPFGCKIRVTNLRNNKSVDVRVNDRGGFTKHGRVIDLSKAAAGRIGMLGSGTAKVKIQVVH